MWIVVTPEQQKEAAERQRKIFDACAEEARKKREAREAHVRDTTCPHCGRHDAVPPWLM